MAKKRHKKKAEKKKQKEQLNQKQLDKVSGGAFPTAVNSQITD